MRAALTLRTRITLIAALAVAVAVIAVSLAAFVFVRDQLNRQLDAQLARDATTVANAPTQWESHYQAVGTDPDHDHDHDLLPRVQVIDEKGQRIGGTATLPVTTAAREVAAGTRNSAYDEVGIGGQEYRMLTRACPGDDSTVQIATSLASQHHTLRTFGMTMLATGAFGILGAALLGWWVARSGLRPVHRLTAAVEHVATTSDLSRRIAVGGHDEVGRLAGAFNGMLAALGASRAAQRLLVEDAAHELRTPLTSMRTNVELLIRAESTGRSLSAADRAKLLADLDAQSVELSTLVAELVDLAREDADPEPAEPLDLAEVTDGAVRRIAARNPDAVLDVDLAGVLLSGRPAALDRMVANLLDNAVKWSPADAPVRVRLRQDGGDAVLTVSDAGPGIDDADLPRIFERFYRAPGARAVPGSGLGLAIVAQVVDLHDGRIDVGRSPAGGAEFTVALPAADQSLSPAPPPED